MKTKRSSRRGFTLIELLLVLVILAVLAAVVIPKLTGRVDDSRRRATIAEISNLKTALESFEIDNGRYPTTSEGLQALVEAPAGMATWTRKYVDEVPTDKWGRAYLYQGPDTVGEDEGYNIISFGTDGEQGTPDDLDKYTKNCVGGAGGRGLKYRALRRGVMRRPFGKDGFTLMELVLVLAVIAICAAIAAPTLSGFARGRALPNAATELVTTARWCRMKALSDGVEYRLNLDARAGTWWVTKDDGTGTNFVDVTEELGRAYTLPDGVAILDITFETAPDAQTDAGTFIYFKPGGRTEVASVTLTYGTMVTVVLCDSPLGSFRIETGATQ
jgi:general secretion pathway protein G